MAFLVVTRLRLRDPKYLDEFVRSAFAVVDQANNSEGNLAAEVLAGANETYWTRTAWSDRHAMSDFMTSEPHLGTMGNLSMWCDEATFVDWEQNEPDLPDWQAAFNRLVRDGQGPRSTTPPKTTRVVLSILPSKVSSRCPRVPVVAGSVAVSSVLKIPGTSSDQPPTAERALKATVD
jgi:heme-degrading monooxygenase HmoA